MKIVATIFSICYTQQIAGNKLLWNKDIGITYVGIYYIGITYVGINCIGINDIGIERLYRVAMVFIIYERMKSRIEVQ